MMILSMRMSSDVILTSIRTLFPLLLRVSSEHVCLDANVRDVKLIMLEAFFKRLRDNLRGRQCSFTSFQRFKLGQTIVSNDPQSSLGPPSPYIRFVLKKIDF